ncbi:MAG: acyltransferase [Thermocrispum agreste]|uniref:Acyltransferase n=1 Tax=Thermocrispum agreste TaxID=37925 RepID=A0A2W4JNF4_9PSEU|nr:MAG: acyltransferase [Thermocrispum agreste]
MASAAARQANWDFIRIVAVLGVVIGHVTFLGPRIMPGVDEYPIGLEVRMGASTLLVLSAYFACVTLRRGTPGRWLVRRLARLLPAYLAAVLIVYVVSRIAVLSFNGWEASGLFGRLFGEPQVTDPGPGAPAPWYLPDVADLVANVLLVPAWHRGWVPLDYSYWTLPLQVLAFIAAALVFSRRPNITHIRNLARGLVALSAAASPLKLMPSVMDGPAYSLLTGLGVWNAYLFGLGVAIWLWSRGHVATGELTLLCAVGTMIHFGSVHWEIAAGLAFAAMLAAIAAAARGTDWAFLQPVRRPLAWLAGLTYCVYLVHQQLGYVLARVLSDAGLPAWPRLIAVLAAVGLAGYLLHVLVERPAYRALTQRRTPATPSPQTPATATA